MSKHGKMVGRVRGMITRAVVAAGRLRKGAKVVDHEDGSATVVERREPGTLFGFPVVETTPQGGIHSPSEHPEAQATPEGVAAFRARMEDLSPDSQPNDADPLEAP